MPESNWNQQVITEFRANGGRVGGGFTGAPLVLVHGVTGFSSGYLNALEALGGERPVVFYDQLGGGKADRPNDTSLWRMERYVDELGKVREALGLRDVHLYGHSFGTMVVADYMLTGPRGVRSVVFASPALSIPRWIQDSDRLRATLPQDLQEAITRNEKAGTPDAPEYQAALMAYYQRYLTRTMSDEEMGKALGDLNQAVYNYMQGPSEFTITGTLKDYDRTSRLHEISVPTLFTAGQFDEATPDTVRYYQSLMPHAEVAIVENAAHLTMIDQPAEYVRILREFLRKAEGGS